MNGDWPPPGRTRRYMPNDPLFNIYANTTGNRSRELAQKSLHDEIRMSISQETLYRWWKQILGRKWNCR